MKLHGLDVSSPTNKVRYLANALGVDYEFNLVMPLSEQTQNEDYQKLHPAGKVPVLEDGDTTLFESAAIIKYLARKYKSSYYPEDIEIQAKIDQWIDFVSVHVRSAMVRVFWNTVGIKFMGEEVDEKSLQAGREFLDRFLPILDKQLGKNKYLAGNELTLADFNLLAELDAAEPAGVDITQYPNLNTWRENLRKEDFYQVDRSFGESLLAKHLNAN
ncbi:MAG: glutathione S-transferase family protein [Deltaproteobacteria bacterium]|nr:glutathione S-transferase family protein [Deltaproteobacteria bacterium]